LIMRGIRRLVVCTVVSGLLAAGAIGGTIEIAHADGTVGPCFGASDSTPTAYSCTLSGQFSDASSVTVSVTDDVTNSGGTTDVEDVTVNVTTLSCTDNNSGTLSVAASSMTGPTTLTDQIAPLPANIGDGQCNVAVTVSAASAQPTGDTLSEFSASLNYTSSANASPSPTTTTTTSTSSSVHPVKGYDGKCLDDKGNSSSNRAQIIIWSCSGSDQAENWTFSNGEFKHNNKCLNDQGNGGNRSKVILYSCNGGSNEKWSELANGEIKLSSHNGTLCVDDPRSSKTNGTQMIVYSCSDSANQKWSLP
jgi:ricin-type beta-trefoil lectin protein